jgi:hypothetical protein
VRRSPRLLASATLSLECASRRSQGYFFEMLLIKTASYRGQLGWSGTFGSPVFASWIQNWRIARAKASPDLLLGTPVANLCAASPLSRITLSENPKQITHQEDYQYRA